MFLSKPIRSFPTAARGPSLGLWAIACLSVAMSPMLWSGDAWGQPPAATDLRSPSPREQQENAQLESLLQRVDLPKLRMLHLEQQVPQQSGDLQVSTAKRLATLYADRLLVSQTPEQQQDLHQRIANLIARVPSADTPELSIVLLQAHFQQAEKDALAWLNDRDAEARNRVAPKLTELGAKLEQQYTTTKALLPTLEEKLDEPNLGRSESERLEKQVNQTSVLMLRAAFLGGWANYYNALVNGQADAIQQQPLLTARTLFRSLLALDEEGARATPEWLGIDAPAKARSLIGLAATEVALDNVVTGEQYFELLLNPVVTPEIRDQVAQWHVRAFLNVGKLEQARHAARQYIEGFTSESTPGRAQLCASLIQAAYLDRRDEQMGTLGIDGLARIGEFKLLRQLLEKHQVRLENPEGFYLKWVSAQQLLAAAEETKIPGEFRAAADAFGLALKEDLANVGQQSIAQCRNEFAWALYHAQNWREAAAQYEQAAEILDAIREQEAAVKAAWMSCVAWQQAAKVSEALSRKAEQALSQLAQKYPNSEYGRKARYQLAKMTGKDSTKVLENVPASDPNYMNAKYDLCALRHQRWFDARGTVDEPTEAAAVTRAVESYLALPAEKPPERAFRAAILGVEAAVDGRPSQPEAMKRLLNQAEQLQSQVRDAALLASFHYHSLRRRFAEGNTEQAETHANWLRDNPAGKKYEQTALVILAKSAETSLRNATDAQRTVWLQKTYEIYSRLSKSLGDDAETLSQNRNAQVALFKRADLELQLGKPQQAGGRFDQLLEISPKNRQFIRGAAEAHFRSKAYEAALEHWRDLVRATTEGDADWYEAKYHQVMCLVELRPTTAKKVMEQFKVLHPDPPAPWKERFQAVAARLK